MLEEWGPQGVSFQQQLGYALDLTDNDAAASQARQVVSGQKAILKLLRWPQDELARLKRSAPQELITSHSRGGV